MLSGEPAEWAVGDAIKFCILEFQEKTRSVRREKENGNDGGKQEKLSLKGQDSLRKWLQTVLKWKFYGSIYINDQGLQIHWWNVKWVSYSQAEQARQAIFLLLQSTQHMKRETKNWGLKI